MNLYNKFFYFIFIIYFAESANAQIGPSLQMERALGGTYDDGISYIISIPNNKIVLAGYAESNDGDVVNPHLHGEFWILQLDSNLNIEWSKCYGGSLDEVIYSIKASNDGGYVLAGMTESTDGDVTGHHGGFASNDIWIVKIDSLRNIEWQQCYGGVDDEQANDIILTSDNNYFLVARTDSHDGVYFSGTHGGDDIWACKLDTFGNIIWSRCLGGTNWDIPASCVQTLDGGFLIAGSTESNDGYVLDNHGGTPDSWVVRLDSLGQELWRKCYGGFGIENGQKIILTWDNGFYLISSATSQDGDVGVHPGFINMWLLRADSSGAILWNKCYGQTVDEPFSAIRTSDGGIVMAGLSLSNTGPIPVNHGAEDMAVIKVDSMGNFVWGNAFGGSSTDVAYTICETPTNNLILAGHTVSQDGDVTNAHAGINGDGDGWVVKLNSLPLNISEQEGAFMNLNIFQSNDQLNLRFFAKSNENAKVFIYDISSKQVFEKNISINEGINYSQVSCIDFAKGMYVVKIEGEKNSTREKIFVR